MIELFKSGDFTHELFGSLTTIKNENNDIFFIGKEVVNILGYTNPSKALNDHVREKHKFELDNETLLSFGIDLGQRGGILISESGLYTLILKSNMPNAEKFQDWVVEEVLPSIRKTGSFSVQHQLPQTFAEALMLAAQQAMKIEEQQKQLEVAAPKVESFDKFIGADGLYSVNDAAKSLGVGQKKLFEAL
jgi:prophage antirepressor-like protein